MFFAELDGKPAGCVGIRPATGGVCEMKRLYVEPDMRGTGVGRELALAAIKAAKALGYRKVMLDTLPAMRIAVKLYRELGFKEAPAYYPTPVEGAMFLALDRSPLGPTIATAISTFTGLLCIRSRTCRTLRKPNSSATAFLQLFHFYPMSPERHSRGPAPPLPISQGTATMQRRQYCLTRSLTIRDS